MLYLLAILVPPLAVLLIGPKYRTDARAWVWVRRAMQHKKESV